MFKVHLLFKMWSLWGQGACLAGTQEVSVELVDNSIRQYLVGLYMTVQAQLWAHYLDKCIFSSPQSFEVGALINSHFTDAQAQVTFSHLLKVSPWVNKGLRLESGQSYFRVITPKIDGTLGPTICPLERVKSPLVLRRRHLGNMYIYHGSEGAVTRTRAVAAAGQRSWPEHREEKAEGGSPGPS